MHAVAHADVIEGTTHKMTAFPRLNMEVKFAIRSAMRIRS